MRKILLTFLVLFSALSAEGLPNIEKGLLAYVDGDYKTAVRILQEIYDKRDEIEKNTTIVDEYTSSNRAAYRLGWIYKKGEGVKQDYTKAAEYFQHLVDNGLKAGQYALGNMYKNGQGVKQDYTKAAILFQEAANQGHTYSRTNLAALYISGQGVKVDKVKAYQLLTKSVEEGDNVAQHSLDILCGENPSICGLH